MILSLWLLSSIRTQNVKLNLPHHLNYVATLTLPCKMHLAHRAPETASQKPVPYITFAVTLVIAVRF